ncbi:hypothetical protein GCM10020358_52720 [Amorphoplanes nipponensis]|uniref:Uncharacterized protein n=1 Tax=Actinoplanes nipponensis TaxID=135950 RepID=A0A919JF80_9ACTN|nr:hypothetical protein Ani05nite_31220 [Actinoplanes nipponensis]
MLYTPSYDGAMGMSPDSLLTSGDHRYLAMAHRDQGCRLRDDPAGGAHSEQGDHTLAGRLAIRAQL